MGPHTRLWDTCIHHWPLLGGPRRTVAAAPATERPAAEVLVAIPVLPDPSPDRFAAVDTGLELAGHARRRRC